MKPSHILAVTDTRSWRTKAQLDSEIGNATIDLHKKSLKEGQVREIKLDHFIRELERGAPHVMANYFGKSRRQDDVTKLKVNALCFDIDKIPKLPQQELVNLFKNIKHSFHLVQESLSSGKKLSEKRLHCYLFIDELEGSVDYVKNLYHLVRKNLSVKLAVEIDKHVDPLKIIGASGKKVHRNYHLETFDMEPLKEELRRMEEELKEQNRQKRIKKENFQKMIANSQIGSEFDESYVVDSLSVSELVKALSHPDFSPVEDYDDWFCYLYIFNDLYKNGNITEEERDYLASVIDDGNDAYEYIFGDVLNDDRYNYSWTIGTLIYRLQEAGVQMGEILKTKEKSFLEPDVIFEVQDYISNDRNAMNELKELFKSSKYRGKRILLYADTGTGKSAAIQKTLQDVTKEEENVTSIFSTGRLALIDNFRANFSKISRSTVITGSDRLTYKEKKKLINSSQNILTTIDSAPMIYREKYDNHETHHFVGILDETHMAGEDSNFKNDKISEYMAMEETILSRGGSIIHITATPETLNYRDFDFVIQVKSKSWERPFKHASYTEVMTDVRKNVFIGIEDEISKEMQDNADKKLLVYIENKKILHEIHDKLSEKGIYSVVIESGLRKLKSEEAIEIIDQGAIPKDVSVVLATTYISAGISIENNSSIDETWVVSTAESLNSDFTRVVQMSNRFRNNYHKLRLFIERKEDNKKKGKQFSFHSILSGRVNQAEKMVEITKKIRSEGSLPNFPVDTLESENGIVTDYDGGVHVCSPTLVSKVIEWQRYFNLANPMHLIEQLEEKFSITFEKQEWNNPKLVQSKSSKIVTFSSDKRDRLHEETLNKILNSNLYYEDLKRDYANYGENKGVLTYIRPKIRKDVIFCLSKGISHKGFKNIMQAHKKGNSVNNVSYVADLKAYRRMKDIKRKRAGSTIETVVVKEIRNHIEREYHLGNELSFDNKSRLNKFINAIIKQEARKMKIDTGDLNIDVDSIRSLLILEEKKSSGKRKYVIRTPAKAFKNRLYIINTYGIDPISNRATP